MTRIETLNQANDVWYKANNRIVIYNIMYIKGIMFFPKIIKSFKNSL